MGGRGAKTKGAEVQGALEGGGELCWRRGGEEGDCGTYLCVSVSGEWLVRPGLVP